MLLAITNAVYWQFLIDKRDSLGSIEAILKSAGILAAGVWAFWHFWLKRERYPRGALEHRVQFSSYSTDEWHLRVNLRIKNDSAVLMRVLDGYTWVQQMQPWPEDAVNELKEKSKAPAKAPCEVRWLLIGEKCHNKEREVEPGEIDEVAMDFFINKYYKQILVYSFIENSAKPGRHLGWTTSTTVDFTKPDGGIIDQGQGQDIAKPRPDAAKN